MKQGQAFTSRRSVLLNLAVAIAQTVALGVAAVATGSAAMKTQTATNVADVAVGIFLLIGVVSSNKPPDDAHPLGYGRERFFWSFVATVGIFVGGVGAAVAETLQTVLHPVPTGSYLLGYAILAVVVALDVVALTTGLRPLVDESRERRMPLTTLLWRGTDPAVTTVVLSSAAGVAGGLIAAVGLAGSPAIDAAASAVIGVILLATSVILLHTNRELLTGRGVAIARITQLRRLIGDEPGVVAVPDLFAIVVGPSSVIVDADVIFNDDLTVPQVETIIVGAADALRTFWPAVSYVYLNPVAEHRPRRLTTPARRPLTAADATAPDPSF